MKTAVQFKKALLSYLRARIEHLEKLKQKSTLRVSLSAKLEELYSLKYLIEEVDVKPVKPEPRTPKKS